MAIKMTSINHNDNEEVPVFKDMEMIEDHQFEISLDTALEIMKRLRKYGGRPMLILEDPEYTARVSVEKSCRCRSLLAGHETGCLFAPKPDERACERMRLESIWGVLK